MFENPFSIIDRRFNRIESLLEELTAKKQQLQPEALNRWLDLAQLCGYHPDKPKKQTVYGWVSAGTIPHHKDGKKLRFLKSEIDEWLLNGRKKTVAETAIDADRFLSTKRVSKGGAVAR